MVGGEADLFARVRAILRADDRFTDSGDNVHCDGSAAPLTNLYPVKLTAADWYAWPTSSLLPEPQSSSALVLECRSPSWVAEVCALLAEGMDVPLWIVDSDDAVWPAGRVDPDRVSLG